MLSQVHSVLSIVLDEASASLSFETGVQSLRVIGVSQRGLRASFQMAPPPGVSADQDISIKRILKDFEEVATDKSPILKQCNQLLKLFKAVGWTSRQQIPTDQAGTRKMSFRRTANSAWLIAN